METTSNRFNNAVTKLYNAFHNGELISMDCAKCAVGSIVGGSGWSTLTWRFIDFPQHDLEDIPNILKTGYSAKELREVERIFMFGYSTQKTYGSGVYRTKETKEDQFIGLCHVVEYLCELEGIPNVMDYTKLFETENDVPAYKLENVF